MTTTMEEKIKEAKDNREFSIRCDSISFNFSMHDTILGIENKIKEGYKIADKVYNDEVCSHIFNLLIKQL